MEARTGKAPTGFWMNATLYLTRAILSRYWVWSWLAPLGGVPLSQLELIKRNPEVFTERILQICSRDMWTKDNYFYYGYIVGKFSKECCPRYLEEQHFAYCKANAHRVIPFKGTWAEAAQTRTDFTVYSLLDSMDWMPPAMVAENIGRIIPQMNHAKGRIFWRSFSEGVHSAPLVWLKPQRVDDSGDRVAMYWSTWMAKIDGQIRFDLRSRQWATTKARSQSFLSSLSTGVKIEKLESDYDPREDTVLRAFVRALATRATADAEEAGWDAEGEAEGDGQ